MKAIVLCAGEGTRLRPITFTGPKHLIPIANKPILLHIIDDIVAAGINQVGIIINRKWEQAFRDALNDTCSHWGIDVDYIYQDQPLGLAHAAGTARGFVGDEPFLMCLGDNLLQQGIKPLVNRFNAENLNCVVSLYEVKNPSAFGVADLKGQRISRVVEKPKEPPSNWAIVGMYVFDPNVFGIIDNLKPSWRGEYEITDAIQGMIDAGFNVAPHFIEGWWMDTGQAADMIEANRRVLLQTPGSRVTDAGTIIWDEVRPDLLPEDTTILNSEIRGPIIIGKGCHIEDSYIGPFTSLGDGVRVVRSGIENSILLDHCEVYRFKPRLDKSIIGRRAKLTSATGPTATLGVADDSVIEF
ncbi:MAG: glucose-1-phosphate thymidylyltransferase [Anaerolineae bacterium]|nr:glucose-1-phosphate thymidylyltransferase [Anaerolineae bacterium]